MLAGSPYFTPSSVTAWLVLDIDVKYVVIKIPVGFWVFVGFCILLIASSQQSLHAVRSALIIWRSLFRFSWTSGVNVSSWLTSTSASHPDSSFPSIFCILRGKIGVLWTEREIISIFRMLHLPWYLSFGYSRILLSEGLWQGWVDNTFINKIPVAPCIYDMLFYNSIDTSNWDFYFALGSNKEAISTKKL